MTDLGDPKSVSKRTKENLRSATARAEMLRAILGLRQGRDFIADYLSRCHINAPSFSTDPLRMAFLEGERNIGLQLLADITSTVPDLYAQMLKEQGEKDAGRDLTDANALDTAEPDPAEPSAAASAAERARVAEAYRASTGNPSH